MKYLRLYNRFKTPVYLEKLSETEYKLVVEEDYPDGESYIQYSYDTDKDGNNVYFSVDPDGGPYIQKGLNQLTCFHSGIKYNLTMIVDAINVSKENGINLLISYISTTAVEEKI